MQIDFKEKTPTYPHNFVIGDKKIWFGSTCGRHMIQAQSQAPKGGGIELAYRTLAILLKESMGEQALSYQQLLDLPTSELGEVLEAIQ